MAKIIAFPIEDLELEKEKRRLLCEFQDHEKFMEFIKEREPDLYKTLKENERRSAIVMGKIQEFRNFLHEEFAKRNRK